MAFQNFLDRLMAGDVRAFVVLGLLALLVFVIYRYLQKVLYPYRGYIKFVGILLVGLAIYTWAVHPERMAAIFNGVVDWVAARIEPLVEGGNDAFSD